jgi:hypothetical protein
MIRRLLPYSLFVFFAALTLGLAVLTVRGFSVADSYRWPGAIHVAPGPHGPTLGTCYGIYSGRGRFYFVANYHIHAGEKAGWSTVPVANFHLMIASVFKPTHSANYFVFQHDTLVGEPFNGDVVDFTGPHDMLLQRDIIVPAWVPLGLCAGVCALLFLPIRHRWRTALRAREGLCLKCGFDLRAHQVGARCPECGMVKAAVA